MTPSSLRVHSLSNDATILLSDSRRPALDFNFDVSVLVKTGALRSIVLLLVVRDLLVPLLSSSIALSMVSVTILEDSVLW